MVRTERSYGSYGCLITHAKHTFNQHYKLQTSKYFQF